MDDGIVETSGRNRGKEYRVNASVLKQSDYKGTTSLKRIEPYRLRELIIEDLKIYECSGLKDVQQRIGIEIPYKKVLEQIKAMLSDGIIEPEGENRWIKYKLKKWWFSFPKSGIEELIKTDLEMRNGNDKNNSLIIKWLIILGIENRERDKIDFEREK